MTNALWFAFAIALGTLLADLVRYWAKDLRWRVAVRRSRRLPTVTVRRNESAR